MGLNINAFVASGHIRIRHCLYCCLLCSRDHVNGAIEVTYTEWTRSGENAMGRTSHEAHTYICWVVGERYLCQQYLVRMWAWRQAVWHSKFVSDCYASTGLDGAVPTADSWSLS
jgi:hypothetical protein